MSDADTMARESQALANRIKPLLAGHSPLVQGAALAELVSLWLAGHYQFGPELSETILQQHIELVRELTPVNIKLLKGEQ
jgi:hypothetical protein